MTGTLQMLNGEKKTYRWTDTLGQEEVEKAFDQIVANGGTVVAGDGTRLDKFDPEVAEQVALSPFAGG